MEAFINFLLYFTAKIKRYTFTNGFEFTKVLQPNFIINSASMLYVFQTFPNAVIMILNICLCLILIWSLTIWSLWSSSRLSSQYQICDLKPFNQSGCPYLSGVTLSLSHLINSIEWFNLDLILLTLPTIQMYVWLILCTSGWVHIVESLSFVSISLSNVEFFQVGLIVLNIS